MDSRVPSFPHDGPMAGLAGNNHFSETVFVGQAPAPRLGARTAAPENDVIPTAIPSVLVEGEPFRGVGGFAFSGAAGVVFGS